MTPKTLFTIIIKIFGLWMTFSILEIIPQVLATLPMFIANGGININSSLIIMILIPVFYILIIWLLLFKSELIITYLSLDKHFEQDQLHFQFTAAEILRVVILIIGGLLILEAIPKLIEQGLNYVQKDASQSYLPYSGYSELRILISKMFLGLILIYFNRSLCQLISKKPE